MHIYFSQTLIIHKNACCINAQYLSSYICIYVCLLSEIDFCMPFNMICISKHNIMLLQTLLLQIYPNYVLYGMYEICDCIYVIVLTLFYHSSYPSFYVNLVS